MSRDAAALAARQMLTASLVLCMVACAAQESGSESPQARFDSAVTALRLGEDFSRVNETALWLKKTKGFEEHGRLLTAAIQLKGNDPTGALRQLQRLRPTGDLVAPARLWTAEALYRTGLLNDAWVCAAPLVDDPEYAVEGHRWLAAISYDIGNNVATLHHLQEVIRLAPDDYRPRALAGRMYFDFAQHAPAARHLSAALERHPPPGTCQELALKLARAQMALHDYKAALSTLTRAEADASVLALTSECHGRLGNADDARDALAEALAIDPENHDVLSRQADAFLADSEPELAADVLQRIVNADPFDHHARYRLALAYRQLGRDEEADIEAERVAELKAKYDRLSDLSQQAIEDPGDAELRRELATICDGLGRSELAKVWRRAAAAIDEAGSRDVAP